MCCLESKDHGRFNATIVSISPDDVSAIVSSSSSSSSSTSSSSSSKVKGNVDLYSASS